jgi:hypothetical protein
MVNGLDCIARRHPPEPRLGELAEHGRAIRMAICFQPHSPLVSP